jgi:hypothetical protein
LEHLLEKSFEDMWVNMLSDGRACLFQNLKFEKLIWTKSKKFGTVLLWSFDLALQEMWFDMRFYFTAELGINPNQIMKKTMTVLNPFRVNPDLHEDADLSGPFIFCMLFGLCQLLGGKFHFGIILGWTSLSSLFLYVVFNLLAGKNGNLELYRCFSLVGYSLLPMVVFSALSLFVPHG